MSDPWQDLSALPELDLGSRTGPVGAAFKRIVERCIRFFIHYQQTINAAHHRRLEGLTAFQKAQTRLNESDERLRLAMQGIEHRLEAFGRRLTLLQHQATASRDDILAGVGSLNDLREHLDNTIAEVRESIHEARCAADIRADAVLADLANRIEAVQRESNQRIQELSKNGAAGHPVAIALIECPNYAQAATEFRVLVSLLNLGAEPLNSFPPNPLHLSYRWMLERDGASIEHESKRTRLWRPVEPNASHEFAVDVVAPREPGDYILRVTLVKENLRWFDGGRDAIFADRAVAVGLAAAPARSTINDYEEKITSQNGEDGILKELFFRLGTLNKTAVEFGVETGLECLSALWVRRYGWHGLLMDGDDQKSAALERNYADFPGAKTACRFITRENIVETFREFDIPVEFDLLCIDIDGNDYWIWKALEDYRPRVVVIEYNAAIPPPRRWVMKYDPEHVWDGSTYFGASLESLLALGTTLGYALLGTDRNGVNAFFIRNDLLERSGFPALSADEAYHAAAYQPYPERAGEFVEQ